MARHTHDVVVIGAGAAGLTAAGGCALYGLRVALVERARMGGECLNTGCVPSKALLAAAARAQGFRTAAPFGIAAADPAIDFGAVNAHVHRAIATIAPHDSVERFEAMGVEVITGEARFVSAAALDVAGRRLTAPRFVVATGSRPRIPPVPGLAETPYLTNETLWVLATLPTHLAILGAGAIGVEMAQAFRRLGAAVTLIGRPLLREDAAAAAVVLARLRGEGVRLVDAAATRAAATSDGVALTLATGEVVAASHLLVAAGRAPEFGALALATAGVALGNDGIRVDARRRTSAAGIYAIGDCREGPRFTHAAGYEGAAVVREIALGLPAPVDYRALPRVLYTDPELAQVGLTETDARACHTSVAVTVSPFADDDRAVAEGATDGFVKLVRAGGRVIGVTIVGAHAGELLLPWSQIIARRATPFGLVGTIVAYPTRSERSKEAAFLALEPRLFHPVLKRWARLLASLR